MIHVRKKYPVFGRGDITFLNPANPKVLAYIRHHDGVDILCVSNLSRFAQPVELDLSQYNGRRPVELIGDTPFPKIGELPYFLTLGPHAFFWFRLDREE
jgi:maltose alpha-D-glucosyltransferase/alpha-amylase